MVTVTATHPGTGGWTLHELSGPTGRRFFIWEKSRGRERFAVYEKGTGRRGTGRWRGSVQSLAAAVQMASQLEPSTPEEILADVPVYGDDDREKIAELCRLGQPGTRLWVVSRHSASGLGYAATSEGLDVNGIEAMLSSELGCWLIRWRSDDGQVGKGLYAVALEDARRAWWILSDHGEVVAGDPPIYDAARAAELAAEFGGRAQLGLGSCDPDAVDFGEGQGMVQLGLGREGSA